MTTRDSLLTIHTTPVAEGSLSHQGTDGGHQNAVTDVFLRRTGQLVSFHCKAGMESRRVKRFLQGVWYHCHAGGNHFACIFFPTDTYP